ncbi:OmpA family protein [Maribacter sp. MMG018]|uniref:OmpA family protein n=1 Tax=Maribacter sp. MMG018 TaxID=2822688 RepID=UPI001B39A88D|nr:OmpA family protein [Maribacter sp. MMG018]MBQ4914033.1 OmpA family protein [Maribacter sp. MMG018]
MKFKVFVLFLLMVPSLMLSQDKKSKGDIYFYGYQYEKAIEQYRKEMAKGPLTNRQLLNLADSYFKVGSYSDASELYMEVNKNDTIMSVHQFNKLLQSLSKSMKEERVESFLRSKSSLLSKELMENAEFNYKLLKEHGASGTTIVKNLSVNTPQADFSPAFYKNKILFSSSRPLKSKELYEPSGESYLDIFEATVDKNGNLSNATVFSKIPDSKFHKSTPFYSSKLNRFFYILSNTEEGNLAFDDNGKNALAVGMLYDSGQFRFLLKDLSTSFYYPFFDENTDRLYFSANFDDSYGGTDLYYVMTNNGQIMSAPINLGPRINSPGNEIAPYIFNNSLYFSSDVFYGLGGMDVYKSNILGNNSYSIPVNIGEGINSEDDDFGFIIKENEGNEYIGFFASNRSGGKGGDDLYSFKMNKLPGLKTFILKGSVVNLSSKTSISKAQVLLLNAKGEVLKEVYASEDGSFSAEIPWEEQITVKATKESFSIFSKTYSEKEMEEVQKSTYDIGLVLLDDLVEEVEGKRVLKLRKFYFDKNKSEVTESVASELKKVIEAVASFPDLRLRIETHTNSKGSSAYNKKLSQQRSDAIKSYLLKNGLSSENILEAVGYGEEKIINNCTNGVYCLDFLHKQNERTLIEVVNR